MSTRVAYTGALEDLRLQVELMGIKVDQNLERMREVLRSGDRATAEVALGADDDIDETNVALTNRCYELTALQAPVAADLRLVVSVVRVASELERVGDLALRVVKVGMSDHALLAAEAEIADILAVMADRAVEAFRMALEAWSTQDPDVAHALENHTPLVGFTEQLAASITRLRGPYAPVVAARAVTVGQALDRIADHARVITARVRYLASGDPAHLAAEVR